jgi:hypothetical protein
MQLMSKLAVKAQVGSVCRAQVKYKVSMHASGPCYTLKHIGFLWLCSCQEALPGMALHVIVILLQCLWPALRWKKWCAELCLLLFVPPLLLLLLLLQVPARQMASPLSHAVGHSSQACLFQWSWTSQQPYRAVGK